MISLLSVIEMEKLEWLRQQPITRRVPTGRQLAGLRVATSAAAAVAALAMLLSSAPGTSWCLSGARAVPGVLCAWAAKCSSAASRQTPRSLSASRAIAHPKYLSKEDHRHFTSAGYSDRSAIYGTASQRMMREELWTALRSILKQPSVEPFLESGTFVDLGSGEGELVLTTLSLFPSLSQGIGVELSHERHLSAEQNAADSSPDVGQRADFIWGDICDKNNKHIMEAIAAARVLFVNNVMFESKLIACLSDVILGLIATRGHAAVVIAVGKQLDIRSRASAYQSTLMTGSWGLAPSYVYGILPQQP
eukprot:TRINITY_DN23346_c0_g1_i1.p1 TRINITY_DN23346_c0_g1~~TRINITY_DN23346_c0_g1_i1.p1  ORF type:complete len:306 (-),score=61.71 TRINITY_DN23346_c0_g1_i1:423-1340(-)